MVQDTKALMVQDTQALMVQDTKALLVQDVKALLVQDAKALLVQGTKALMVQDTNPVSRTISRPLSFSARLFRPLRQAEQTTGCVVQFTPQPSRTVGVGSLLSKSKHIIIILNAFLMRRNLL